MSPQRLAVFDMDGTLMDSQDFIVRAMEAAFAQHGLRPPPREAILSIVGLSLERAMATLTPELDAAVHTQMADAYRSHYADQRQLHGAEGMPLYPGAVEMLEHLASRPEVLLGVATGKSRRGLDALIETVTLGLESVGPIGLTVLFIVLTWVLQRSWKKCVGSCLMTSTTF